jgi:hypothetical protein
MFQKCAPAGVDAPTVTLFTDDLNAWLADPNAKGAVNDGYGTIVYHEGRWMTARQKGVWKIYLEHQTAVTELKGMQDDVRILSAEEACYETTATMVVLCENVAAQELVVEAALERKERYWEGREVTGKVGRGEDKRSLKAVHLLTIKLDEMKDVKQKKVRGCMSDKALDRFLTLV